MLNHSQRFERISFNGFSSANALKPLRMIQHGDREVWSKTVCALWQSAQRIEPKNQSQTHISSRGSSRVCVSQRNLHCDTAHTLGPHQHHRNHQSQRSCWEFYSWVLVLTNCKVLQVDVPRKKGTIPDSYSAGNLRAHYKRQKKDNREFLSFDSHELSA